MLTRCLALAAVLACQATAQVLRGDVGSAGGGDPAATLPAGWCRNSAQGRQYVADNAGRVCEWAATDAKGCCATSLEACQGCDKARRAGE